MGDYVMTFSIVFIIIILSYIICRIRRGENYIMCCNTIFAYYCYHADEITSLVTCLQQNFMEVSR